MLREGDFMLGLLNTLLQLFGYMQAGAVLL
jgi:hypothetical protein